MESDWLTGLLVVLMVTIAVGLLWSSTKLSGGQTPTPIIIETPSVVSSDSTKDKKKVRQRATNPQQSPRPATREVTDNETLTASAEVVDSSASRSPRKKKVKKRAESTEHVDEKSDVTAADEGAWQTQLSRQQKQELLRQRRQQENTTAQDDDSIERQIASAAAEEITSTEGKGDLMYLEDSNDNEAWLLIDNQNSTS